MSNDPLSDVLANLTDCGVLTQANAAILHFLNKTDDSKAIISVHASASIALQKIIDYQNLNPYDVEAFVPLFKKALEYPELQRVAAKGLFAHYALIYQLASFSELCDRAIQECKRGNSGIAKGLMAALKIIPPENKEYILETQINAVRTVLIDAMTYKIRSAHAKTSVSSFSQSLKDAGIISDVECDAFDRLAVTGTIASTEVFPVSSALEKS